MSLKRAFDLLICLLLFPFFLIFFILCGTLIKLTSAGPVLYRQKRVGYRGKPFYILKFRTMFNNSDKVLEEILRSNSSLNEDWKRYRKLKKDPRITPIGKLLRRTSLDELPQIINVLKGEMSLVGPRPVTEEELDMYYKEWKEVVLSVPPGITGLWQVSGRNLLPYEERVRLDVEYALKHNILLDLKILFKTIFVVITGKGAS